jgi:uncharacterized protein YdhG (YjbR/CyaY superfamily)
MIPTGPGSRRETGIATPTSVEAYIAALPEERRAVVEALRQTITAAAPGATESIAYEMPALRSNGGQFLVSYAAYKHHYSLFPASGSVIEALGEELKPYLSGRGTIRFRADRPIPAELVARVVKARLAEIAARDNR